MFLSRRIAKEQRRPLLALLPMLSLLLATLACGFSIGPHMGYRPPPATHLPASQLRLEVSITGQYAQYGNTPLTLVHVRVFEGANPSEVSFPDKTRLTCNGSEVNLSPLGPLQFPCPQQSPGGSYRLVYTDEHGASTTVVVPVPIGTFAIVTPHDGSMVPIPTNGALAVRYEIPIAPLNGSVAIDNVTAACSLTETQPCGAVYANLQPVVTPTPYGGIVPATATPFRGPPTPTPNPGYPTATPYENRGPPTPTPNVGSGTPLAGATPRPTVPGPAPTVAVTQNGNTGTIMLAGDYSEFQPAKGILSMAVEAHVTPDNGGFAAVTASYSDTLHAQFTWIR